MFHVISFLITIYQGDAVVWKGITTSTVIRGIAFPTFDGSACNEKIQGCVSRFKNLPVNKDFLNYHLWSCGSKLEPEIWSAPNFSERRSRSRSGAKKWAALALALTFFLKSAARARAPSKNERRSPQRSPKNEKAHWIRSNLKSEFFFTSKKLGETWFFCINIAPAHPLLGRIGQFRAKRENFLKKVTILCLKNVWFSGQNVSAAHL